MVFVHILIILLVVYLVCSYGDGGGPGWRRLGPYSVQTQAVVVHCYHRGPVVVNHVQPPDLNHLPHFFSHTVQRVNLLTVAIIISYQQRNFNFLTKLPDKTSLYTFMLNLTEVF